jgi:hypothetical protein
LKPTPRKKGRPKEGWKVKHNDLGDFTDPSKLNLVQPEWMSYEDEKVQEALRHILSGRVLKDPEKYLPRSLFIAFWARFAFNDACAVSFRQAAAKHLMDMLGYSEAVRPEEEAELEGSLDATEKDLIAEQS